MAKHICNHCEGMIVMNAFSFSECRHCGKEVVTPHIPSYEYCEACADKLNKCIQCGGSVE